MDKISKDDLRFIVVGGCIILGLILVIIVILFLGSKKDKSFTDNNLSLDNIAASSRNGDGVFQDKICGVSFKIPKEWLKSSTKLPLPQVPLAQAVFDENNKKSIFSYICYDEKYSFGQFNENTELKPEVVSLGGTDFTRVGNFVYFNKNNKLIIFQMFFTKNDVKPEKGYEEKLMAILGSVK
ncbi:MAG: hypothetical protein PHQ01_02420 [Candidatus Pacebacteria bacterium]|nr:hypothetical protein [Candidatus Paceibacterota bacterium]